MVVEVVMARALEWPLGVFETVMNCVADHEGGSPGLLLFVVVVIRYPLPLLLAAVACFIRLCFDLLANSSQA
jgi:hypothetical protein